MPRVFQSIRFRLSLTIALVVFAVGSFLIGGLYLTQVNQLDRPTLNVREFQLVDPATGAVSQLQFISGADLSQAVLGQIEARADRQALDDLRRSSFGALAVLFITSFGAGFLLSGWALRPVNRLTGVARDITVTDLSRRINLTGPDDELKKMADTFDAMLDRIQDSFEDQRRFVHEASHELRNPLAVARTNLELAQNTGGLDALVKGSEIALRATDRMGVIVDDLLEQVRQGMPSVRREPVDLSRLVVDATVEFKAAAGERSLRIVASPGESIVVNGDESALRRALSNLVANAVRLAPTGSTITIGVASAGECATLTVTDEGPGIARADLESVFQRFWRGVDSGTGSGLGLSIVRQIAERHGGSATVESEPGRGSTFTLKLPAPVPARVDRPAVEGTLVGQRRSVSPQP